jgi:hypothetical protein
MSANTVRNKINHFLEHSDVKIGDFIDTLGVSSNSYYRFMHQHGNNKGIQGATFGSACELFAYMKEKKIPMPKKPRAKKTKDSSDLTPSSEGVASSETQATKAKSTKANSKKTGTVTHDISQIVLPGEEENRIEVYDTCDEVRRKISAHLRKPDVTQAAFCRDLTSMLHIDGRKVSTTQLSAFRGRKGPLAGNTSSAFYAGYMFFEKQRIAAGQPKSKHREEMENAWTMDGGFNITHDTSRGFLCRKNERPVVDKLGQVSFMQIR